MHVFSHARIPYRFDHTDPTDWIARHFFTGGIMPSHRLIHEFNALFAVEQEWRWNGQNYARTADDWLANLNRNEAQIARLFTATYGAEAGLKMRRWRLFFLATTGLFGHRGGEEWGVSHYLLKPAD
jgi:cyclopropane-fatty-acyl-phospholipid synthase